jgi:hypothetical protein
MTQSLPPREEILWREAKRHVAPQDLGATFTDFVEDRLDWSIGMAQEPTTASNPSLIDATRSGSVGGKHSKGNRTRKNAGTVQVQKGNKVKRSARASDYPARIRGSNQASDTAQKRGLTSKPAQERSQDMLSKKRSQEEDITTRSDGEYEHPQGYDPAGPHADQRTRAPEIPGLRLQQDQHATGAALIVGIGVSCDDGISSLVQVTNATTASKDGTHGGTTPAHAPKRMKKSGINKRRASPIPGQGEALQVNNEPDETPQRAYKKPARRQVPAQQQVPSQQPRSAPSQVPMKKHGRMERSQRQATGHTTTPFQTTHPPDGQKRDGPTI